MRNAVKMNGEITQILVFWVSFEDILAIAIEQTDGYKDTWTNMNRTCSLVGTSLTGNMRQNVLTITNTNDITGTGWISAHVEHEGTLRYTGCVYGSVKDGVQGVEISHNSLAECIYICGFSDIFLHGNMCYCARGVTYSIFHSCTATQCSYNGPLLCGKSISYPQICMCRYQSWSTSTRSTCPIQNFTNCTLSGTYGSFFASAWQVTCIGSLINCKWNGVIPRENFYWGPLPFGNGKHHYCVAVSHVANQLLPVTRRCSTELTGLCKKGTRISTNTVTAQSYIVSFSTTDDYDTTSEIISHQMPIHTANQARVTTHEMPKYTIITAELTSHEMPKHTTNKVEMISHEMFSPTTNSRIAYSHLTGVDVTSRTRLMKVESTVFVNQVTSDKPVHASRDTKTDDQTYILGPVLGGVGTFVVIMIASVVIIVVLVQKRRRKETCRSELPSELHRITTGKPHENPNFYSEVDVNGKVSHMEDNGEYISLSSSIKHVSGPDMYDHTFTTQGKTYGCLNRNEKPNSSSDTADIYDHTRADGNGDTYDTFKTGACREDSSNNYYDHTFGGETYGHLGKSGNGMEPADDTYDHSGAIASRNGNVYDSFQTDRDGQETDVDRDEYSSVNIGNGYLN